MASYVRRPLFSTSRDTLRRSCEFRRSLSLTPGGRQKPGKGRTLSPHPRPWRGRGVMTSGARQPYMSRKSRRPYRLSNKYITHHKFLQQKRERFLLKKYLQYELDKVDDIVQDFLPIMNEPYLPPLQPDSCLVRQVLAGPHKHRRLKMIVKLSEQSGLGALMVSHLLRVMGRKEVLLTFKAIAFMPPVTFLRINLLKSSPKALWQELEAGGVSAWIPRWSSVTAIVMDDPNNLCPLVRQLIAQGRCTLQQERQWQQINITQVINQKEHSEGPGKVCVRNRAKRGPKFPTLFYSAKGSISSLVVMVLSAKGGENVLELCATNSGKTPHIAAMQKNYGKLIANTLHREEIQAMMDSNSRCGVKNCVVTNIEPTLLAKGQKHQYCRVLVDAPSTGVGVVRPPSRGKMCTITKDLHLIAARQLNLLNCGADCIRKNDYRNSYLVYTTCSVLVEENEVVVQRFLEQRKNFKLVPTGLDIGKPGLTQYREHRFHEDLRHTRRLYCHHHHMDGFFIAKFVLESKHNAAKTLAAMMLLHKQTHKQDHNSDKYNRGGKYGGNRYPRMKNMYKKGSQEWLKQTFMGEDRESASHSDDNWW